MLIPRNMKKLGMYIERMSDVRERSVVKIAFL